jgi:hypothetical protein
VDGLGFLRGRWLLALLILSVLWVDAHGVHLAANAIGDALSSGTERDAFYATPPGDLDHFLDEGLGHWEWHLAWAGLTALVVLAALRSSARAAAAGWTLPSLGGAIHGATFMLVTTEGGTATLLGIPLSIIVLGVTAARLRTGRHDAALRFFAVASLTTLMLYAGWAAANGGRLVEPCERLSC